MSTNKWYAVTTGRRVGVFDTWTECKECVSGYSGANFRSFTDKKKAQEYFSGSSSGGGSGSSEVDTTCTVYTVYTDGACSGNGTEKARAGVGVYWNSDKHPWNKSLSLEDCGFTDGRQTNQRAEAAAIYVALRTLDREGIDGDASVTLYTDSSYCLKAITQWAKKWEQNGWHTNSGQPVLNRDILEPVTQMLKRRPLVELKWVKGHARNPGNERADALARRGVPRSVPTLRV